MSEISRVCKLLEEEGFVLKYKNRDNIEKAAIVNMWPLYFSPKYFATPKYWKDVPIDVEGFATKNECISRGIGIFCGGHYKFIRTFVDGKEDESCKHGEIPDPDEFVNPPPNMKKRTIEVMEERTKKRNLPRTANEK